MRRINSLDFFDDDQTEIGLGKRPGAQMLAGSPYLVDEVASAEEPHILLNKFCKIE
jgi:hypothetical protein